MAGGKELSNTTVIGIIAGAVVVCVVAGAIFIMGQGPQHHPQPGPAKIPPPPAMQAPPDWVKAKLQGGGKTGP